MEDNLNKENEPGIGAMATLKRQAAGGPAAADGDGPAAKKKAPAAKKPKQPKKAQKPKLQVRLQ